MFRKAGVPVKIVSCDGQILPTSAVRCRWLRFAVCAAFGISLGLLEISCHPTPIRPGVHLDRGTAEILGSADIAFAVRCLQDTAGVTKQGRLAGRRASDPEVRSLALELAEESSKADAQLRAIAAAKLIRFSDLIVPSDERIERKLAKLSGAKFDREYVKHSLKLEQDQLKRYRKEAKSGEDPKIQAFAADRVPALISATQKLKALRLKLHSR